MPEDEPDDLLDALPDGLARKVAKHLNDRDTGAEDVDEPLPVIPPPPLPPPPLRHRRYQIERSRYKAPEEPPKKRWWEKQF